jgi:prevent-host-death family protein
LAEIRTSADLRSNYNEISEYCNKHYEPIYITVNGREDLAVMSIEVYKNLLGRLELQKLIKEGLDASNNGNVRPAEVVFADLERRIG